MDRRIILATQSSAAMLAWYYAATSQVQIAGTNVRLWRDATSGGNNLGDVSVGTRPDWEASGGWDGSHSSIQFPGGSTHELQTTSGQLASLRGAFGILSTLQNEDTANNQTLMAWHGGSHWAAVRIASSAGQAFLRSERFDGTALTGATGTINLGTSHRRIAISWDGSRVSTWVDGVADLVGSTLAGVGLLSTDTFTVGWGGNPFSCNARFTEIQIYRSALTSALVASYQAASLNNWGA